MSGSYSPAKQDAAYTDLAAVSDQIVNHDVETKGARLEIRACVQTFFAYTSTISFKMLLKNIFKDQKCGNIECISVY